MSDQTHELLENGASLQVSQEAIKLFGLNQAIVLHQLDVLLGGVGWVRYTYHQWKEQHFPYWSTNTIQRTFLKLEEADLVLSRPPTSMDRTKWYTLNYNKLMDLGLAKQTS